DDNGKSRHLPLCTELKKSLIEWLEQRGEQDHSYVFLSIRGGKLAEMGIHYLCETIGKKLNIDALTPHVLRHSFAHELLLQGMNLKPLATLLGHKNTNYTRLYKMQMKKNSFQKSKYKPGEPK
ncbi:tyrosine-type recombinase/integrase, partial [Bacillus sp. FJAT-28004]|uniref:tyrosine-type recombinase/integrase n=1 Tax=Bacillus sp. FJAT-28004 TaxID=1679165 RepID=UPI000ACD6687